MKNFLIFLSVIFALNSLHAQNNHNRPGGKLAYMFTGGVLIGGYLGILDANKWAVVASKPLPAWARHDGTTLGGGITLPLMAGSIFYWSPSSTSEFFWTTWATINIASLTWDYMFGWLRYGDPFKDFDDWAFGKGFNNKKERLFFDFVRLVNIYVSYRMSEIVSPKKQKNNQRKMVFSPAITPDGAGFNLTLSF